MTSAPPAASWRAAVSLFTIVPIGGPARIDRDSASRIVLWLPVLGVLLGAVASGALLLVEATGHGVARRLLAAAVALATLGVLTGGLHLDGLADTADGLGSRKPRAEALDIMRKSDIGPMGVSVLLFVLLLQLLALATLPAGWVSAAALTAAAVTGRVAVVLATGLAPARPDGFGALIAGATSRRTRLAVGLALLAAVAAAGAAADWPALAWRGVVAVVAGLAAAGLLQRSASRRLGGTTGDVFGALIEVATATALLAFALVY
jgi:adenosylcobinamide-GDP ribazoletransferase